MNKFRKSVIPLAVLIIASVIQFGLFRLSTGTILILLLTVITAFHITLKELRKRYPGKLFRVISDTYRIGLLIIGILSIIILILIVRPIKECRQLDVQKAESADVMIILGAGLNGDQVSERLKLRLDKALEALNLNPEMTVIVSGGKGGDEKISEAEAMKRYLIKAGIEEKRVIEEDKSTSTHENFLFSKPIIDAVEPSGQILIVTSDFHVFRSQMIAKSLGFDSRALCSTSEPLVLSNYLIREIPAVINDFLRKESTVVQ